MKKKLVALFLCCALSFGLVTAALITPASADSELMIYSEKVAVDTVSVPKNEKKTLAAGGLSGYYQWQIQVGGDVWANIAGATGAELEVGYALVANLLYGGTANIRCRVTGAAEEPVYSNTVAVQITDETPVSAPALAPAAPTVISEAEPVGEPTIIPPQTMEETPAPDAAPANDLTANVAPAALADPAPAADTLAEDNINLLSDDVTNDEGTNDATPADETPSTFSIMIKYVFQDGESQAANPWTATVGAGSSYSVKIDSPVVVGYAPEQTSVDVNVTEISQDVTYTVTYYPAEVDFTVKHYQQNVTGSDYTLVETEPKKGYTESPVGADLAKTYDGFYSLIYVTDTKIAADGSTEVEIYYDRYYYLMKLNLDGGYGLEPIYARYGTPIIIGEPTKPGYTFGGWNPTLPATMPAEDITLTAQWKTGEAGFNVIFWYENPNPKSDGTCDYSVAGTFKPDNVDPGTQKSSGDYKNQYFDGRDDKHFTYNDQKVETVTVAGDGSTVLNVYFTRNTYTLTFLGVGNVRMCGKTEHTHTSSVCCDKSHWLSCNGYGWSGRCNTQNCPTNGEEHTHSSDCNGITITAKYGADIRSHFPIKDSDGATIWWNVPECDSFEKGTMLGSIDTMPGEEGLVFTKANTQSGAKLIYYIETLDDESGTIIQGKNFKEYKTIDLNRRCRLTYSEEFHDITGFTQWWSDPAFDKMEQGGVAYDSYYGGYYYIKEVNRLCYTRNSYKLSFYNYNATVGGKGGSVQYEAPLRSYYFVPDYPDKLEKNAYVFAGWYATADCLEGTEVNFDTMTMPASDVILYAKWTTATHTVKTYLTEDVVEKAEPLNTWDEVPHNTTVTQPTEPVNGNYKFVGWFYRTETGEEKAFDFQMPVLRDLNLYAKWSSNTLVQYTIKYAVENADGTLTYIADDTVGSALAGTTKTFDAKTGTQLKDGYQTGYFPETGSHSITFDVEGNNDFTFIYVPKAKVPYTVRYLDKATGEPVIVDGVPTPDKTVETADAVVTVTFVPIKGYAPDAYQKRLVLSANEEENVLIFWYTKDDVHAPVQIIHWTQNIAGNGYTEYQSSTNLNGVIGIEYSETPLTLREPPELPGFKYNSEKSNSNGELTAKGLVLNLYYDRIEYPYEFRFVEKDSNPENQLAKSVTKNARYQAQVTQSALTIPGYTLVSPENQAINIAIEDGTTAVKNVKTFYYTEQTVEIKYEVAGPEGCGTLDNYQESQLKVKTGTVTGSLPTAKDGFKFVGWYKDKECTQAVDAAWIANNKITPKQTKDLGSGVMGYEAATYYAKFDYDVANLTINKTGCQDIDENQSFIFDVTGPDGYSKRVVIKGTGSVTITGLKVGEYTVTEVTSWSWRYKPTQGSVTGTINPTQPFTFDFTNTRSNGKWLGGDAYSQNLFGTIVPAN